MRRTEERSRLWLHPSSPCNRHIGSDIKLGLGDFVFYSLLVGRASMFNAATLVGSVVAVVAGLCATLALLPIMQVCMHGMAISHSCREEPQ